MITKKVDFIVTFFTTAPVLQGQGVPLKVMKLEDYGQVGYGLSYFSRPQWVSQNSDTIKRFLDVSERAINYTNQNLEEGVRVLCNYNDSLCKDDATVQLNVEEERLQIPLYNSLTPGKPMFCIDPQVWQTTAQLLLDAGTVQSLPDVSKSFTNADVAGCE
jgi:ABC-type nitrate/sulfonate/bicarbonate transport system substrate-binding protein